MVKGKQCEVKIRRYACFTCAINTKKQRDTPLFCVLKPAAHSSNDEQ